MGVAWQGDESSMQGFIDTHGITFPTANDDDGELYARFGIPFQPAWVFVDASGTMDVHLGALEPDELDSVLGELAAGA